MRRVLLAIGLALLLLGAALGLALAGLRLAWDEAPPPPDPVALGRVARAPLVLGAGT